MDAVTNQIEMEMKKDSFPLAIPKQEPQILPLSLKKIENIERTKHLQFPDQYLLNIFLLPPLINDSL